MWFDWFGFLVLLLLCGRLVYCCVLVVVLYAWGVFMFGLFVGLVWFGCCSMVCLPVTCSGLLIQYVSCVVEGGGCCGFIALMLVCLILRCLSLMRVLSVVAVNSVVYALYFPSLAFTCGMFCWWWVC